MPIYSVTGAMILFLIFLHKMMKNKCNQTLDKSAANIDKLKDGNIFTTTTNKIKQAIGKLAETAAEYRRKGILWWSLIAIFSLMFQIGLVWINQLLFKGFGIEIGWIDLIVMISLISFITMLPISLNGINRRDHSAYHQKIKR